MIITPWFSDNRYGNCEIKIICKISENDVRFCICQYRVYEFVFKAALHVLVYAYMELAAIVIERPGTELVYVTVVILQDLFHGPGVTARAASITARGKGSLYLACFILQYLPSVLFSWFPAS